jgi:hypothetical protein
MENYTKTKDGKRHNTSMRHGFGTYFSANGIVVHRGHWLADNRVEIRIPFESPKPFGPDDEDILI